LRSETYKWVFDIQGNTKSGVLTYLSRGDVKVGFDVSSVREWPNILATKIRFSVPKQMNIRLQYISLIRQFFQKSEGDYEFQGVQFIISDSQEKMIRSYFDSLSRPIVMVCPSSKWTNKQLRIETLVGFLKLIQKDIQPSFLLVWGSLEEREYCELVQKQCKKSHVLKTRLEIPTWQYLMNQMDLVIAVDSSALHLCGTTNVPSFSIFGPTVSEIFKPPGKSHFAFQGQCPYGKVFLKQCPVLRSCPTGACMRDITADTLYKAFSSWYQKGTANANPVLPADAL
jgi:heptosyltransferase-1